MVVRCSAWLDMVAIILPFWREVAVACLRELKLALLVARVHTETRAEMTM